MAKERLDKILASQNCGSRKESGAMIRAGRVAVNGTAVKSPQEKADPDSDRIAVDGKPLCYRRFVYLMMNKPGGVLSAARDSRAKTVVDLLPPELTRRGLFPAGRLDRDTEGLLILTDDGDFAHRMLAPKSHVFKIYHAVLDKPADADDVEAFARGIALKDLLCLPAELSFLPEDEVPDGVPLQKQAVAVRIREGKFHQIKRMFAARGKQVQWLKRVKIGELQLDFSLKPGQTRSMTEEEVMTVFQ